MTIGTIVLRDKCDDCDNRYEYVETIARYDRKVTELISTADSTKRVVITGFG